MRFRTKLQKNRQGVYFVTLPHEYIEASELTEGDLMSIEYELKGNKANIEPYNQRVNDDIDEGERERQDKMDLLIFKRD